FLFFFTTSLSTLLYTLSLHDALPIYLPYCRGCHFLRTRFTRKARGLVVTHAREFTLLTDQGWQVTVPIFNVWVAASPVHTVATEDRKSTRLNSSHDQISYAVFCLKKK